jgi:hypothetical protein
MAAYSVSRDRINGARAMGGFDLREAWIATKAFTQGSPWRTVRKHRIPHLRIVGPWSGDRGNNRPNIRFADCMRRINGDVVFDDFHGRSIKRGLRLTFIECLLAPSWDRFRLTSVSNQGARGQSSSLRQRVALAEEAQLLTSRQRSRFGTCQSRQNPQFFPHFLSQENHSPFVSLSRHTPVRFRAFHSKFRVPRAVRPLQASASTPFPAAEQRSRQSARLPDWNGSFFA